MKTRLVVDSRARESGTVGNFWIELRPTIENIRKVSLVWADIPTPLQTPGGPYFMIRVLELGTRTRVVGSTITQAGTTTAGFRRRFVNPASAVTDIFGFVGDAIESATPETTPETTTATVYNTRCGLETTFIVPITVNVDERAFYSPETSFRQEMHYNPPISLHRLSIEISRNYDATQVTHDSVLVFEVEHD
jgi:hypothetical protein